MHVLLDDDQGRLTLRRLRPWHKMLARSRAARLDRELAGGARPEASAALAARAIRLTSMEYRRGLAASLQRMLMAAGEPAILRSQPVTGHTALTGHAGLTAHAGLTGHVGLTGHAAFAAARPPRVPLRLARIGQSAAGLAELAGHLLQPGPVPVRGVAMLSQLLADGGGPLYREASRDDLGAIIERTARALAL